MGEYADMALDAGFSSWGDEEPDEYVGGFRARRLPKLKTCRRCGTTGLHWRETDDGWRLHKTAGLYESVEHECPPATPPLDDRTARYAEAQPRSETQ